MSSIIPYNHTVILSYIIAQFTYGSKNDFAYSEHLSWLLHSSIEFLRYYLWVSEIFLCILNGRNICTLQAERRPTTPLLNQGVPVIEVSRRLGHSRASITLDVYGHLSPSMQSEVADLIDDLVTPVAVQIDQKVS